MANRKPRKPIDPNSYYSWSYPPRGRAEVNENPSKTIPAGDVSTEAIVKRILKGEFVVPQRSGNYDPANMGEIPLHRAKGANIINVSNAIKEARINDVMASEIVERVKKQKAEEYEAFQKQKTENTQVLEPKKD